MLNAQKCKCSMHKNADAQCTRLQMLNAQDCKCSMHNMQNAQRTQCKMLNAQMPLDLGVWMEALVSRTTKWSSRWIGFSIGIYIDMWHWHELWCWNWFFSFREVQTYGLLNWAASASGSSGSMRCVPPRMMDAYLLQSPCRMKEKCKANNSKLLKWRQHWTNNREKNTRRKKKPNCNTSQSPTRSKCQTLRHNTNTTCWVCGVLTLVFPLALALALANFGIGIGKLVTNLQFKLRSLLGRQALNQLVEYVEASFPTALQVSKTSSTSK